MIDNVITTTFRQLFESRIQFVIPFFQRGYAWDKTQWKQLFDDIENEIINDIDDDSSYKDFEHFFSSIVVMPKNNTNLNGIQRFDIIDGQQRITTIYLLLSVIRTILQERSNESIEAKNFINNLNQYLENTLNFGEDGDYKKLKVFSSKGDRLSTYKIVFNSDPQDNLVRLDNQFISHISKVTLFEKWLYGTANTKHKLTKKTTDELILLSSIILDCLKIVWIPLAPDSNNAQAIFESLNARGTPLSASELLCNYIFRGFEALKDERIEELHNDYWLYVANKENIKFDNYLMHLYSIGESKNIGKGYKVYSYFKKNNSTINEENSLNHLKKIKEYFKFYELVINPIYKENIDSNIIDILKDINTTSMESATPFLIEILKDYFDNNLALEELLLILKEILTMIIRIKIVGQYTAQISNLFPSLYSNIKNKDNKIEILHQKFKEFDYFINDNDFKNAFIDTKLYANNNQSFTRMILVSIDKSQHTFGQYPDYSTLNTIEHICPQSGRDETGWTQYLKEDSKDEELSKVIHTIGNLSLLSRPANSHASNNPFKDKIATYHKLTYLNKDIINRYDNNVLWNIESIKNRSSDIADIALSIWKWNK